MNAEEVLATAQKAGIDEAEVYQLVSHATPVYFEANRLKQLETTESEGIALRVWRDQIPGVAVAYGAFDPNVLVRRALALCELNSPEKIELTPNHQHIYPTQGESLSQQRLIEIGKNSIEFFINAYPRVLCSGETNCEQQTTRLINTQGTDCQYTDISVSAFFQVEWVRGEDFLGISDGLEFSDEASLLTIKQNICQAIHWATTTATAPKKRVPVIFTPKAALLFWDTIAAALNGKRVWEKSSPWSDRLQEKVMSEKITLSQKPTQNPERCPFDDEGTPTQELILINQGRLEQFYLDRSVGRLLGQKSTGNGFRSHLGQYPSPSLVNLIVSPGKGTLDDLIAHLDDGLVIDQLLGEDADLSGDFSANIELGYRVQQGKITGRVKDTMITGNVYTALKQLITLGEDIQNNGACQTPSLVVEGLSVVS